MNKSQKIQLVVILVLSLILLGMIGFWKLGGVDNLAEKYQAKQGTEVAATQAILADGSTDAALSANLAGYDPEMVVMNYTAAARMENIPEGYAEQWNRSVATVTAIGDIMMHKWQIERGYDPATDSFDFADSYTYIAPYLSRADFTLGNLETTLAGRYNSYSTEVYGYSGYPTFNSPEIMANNIKDAGVDFVTTANNHSLDSGHDGINLTIDYLDSIGLPHTGTFKTEEASKEKCIVEVNGITFGIVNYTYGTNGLAVPAGAPYCINTLTADGEPYDPALVEKMCNEVRAMDEAGVDVVMPVIHFGTEYWDDQDSWQEMCVDKLFAAGADVIVGGHPHVVEPIEIREITNPDGSKRTGYCVYSLGNFISSQVYDGVWKDIGLIMDMEFTKENGQVKMTKWQFAPTYVYWTDDTIGVVPVVEAHDNPSAYSFLSQKDWDRINASYGHTIETMTNIEDYPYTIEDYRYTFDIAGYEGF